MTHISETRTSMTQLGLTLSLVVSLLGISSVVSSVHGEELNILENPEIRDVQARDPGGHWTPERLQKAQEFTLPLSIKSFSKAEMLTSDQQELLGETDQRSIEGNVGGEQGQEIAPDDKDMLYAPMTPEQLVQNSGLSEQEIAPSIHAQPEEGMIADGPVPEAAGAFKAHYSSSQLVPLDARKHYPYRTVGKLFFQAKVNGQWRDSWCSASVIKPRLILTAGHCVHNGTSAGWHRRWLFVPAEQNGNAPFQAWNWRYVITTPQWIGGGGAVPNAADFAIIELEDRRFGSQVRRIGTVTGWLGYKLNVLNPNHTKKLGYPGNLDAGKIMHQVDSESHRAVAPNNVEYGSNMRGGSSGGPYVQNFGRPAAGQGGEPINPEMNRVVGVTSYGYISTEPRVQGSSILNNSFVNILNSACAHRAGNC